LKKERKAVGITELIEILGVKHQTIYEAIKNGRLSRCIIGKDRQRKFEIYTACIEWDLGREHSQMRSAEELEQALDSSNPANSYPPLSESRQVKEYYEALNERVLLLKQTESLVDLVTVETEVFNLARQTRDRLLEIPEKMRFKLLSVGLSDQSSDEIVKKTGQMIQDVLLEISEFDFSSLKKQKKRAFGEDEGGDHEDSAPA
jgi:hypothetical protein